MGPITGFYKKEWYKENNKIVLTNTLKEADERAKEIKNKGILGKTTLYGKFYSCEKE